MKLARHELLARAGLAAHEHRRVGLRDLLDDGAHAVHRLRVADDGAAPRALNLDAPAQRLVLAAQPDGFERVLDDEAQVVDLEGLREVVVSAGLDRLDCHALRPVGRDHDDERRRLAPGGKLAQEVEAALARQVHVEQQKVWRARGDGRARLLDAGRLRDLVIARAECAAYAVARRLLVVNDEHAPLPRSVLL